MKKIGTLGYLVLGLMTASAFAESTPVPSAAPAPDSSQVAQPAKAHKKSGRKHAHRAHKKHKKPATDQK